MKILRSGKSTPIADKLTLSQSIAAGATGVAALTGIAADITALTTAATELEAANTAALNSANATKSLVEVQNAKEEAWDTKLELTLTGIEHLPAVTQAQIEALGLQVYIRGGAGAVGDLPAPANFTLSEGDHPQEVDAQWDAVRGARGYILQSTTTADVATSWKQAALSTRSSCTLTGLTTGTQYWVRVCAFGPLGNGPFSNPAQKVAP